MRRPAFVQPLNTPQLQVLPNDYSALSTAFLQSLKMREMQRKAAPPPSSSEIDSTKFEATRGELNLVEETMSLVKSLRNKAYTETGGDAELMAQHPSYLAANQMSSALVAKAPQMKRELELQKKYEEHTKDAGSLYNMYAILTGQTDKFGATYGETARNLENAKDREAFSRDYNYEHSVTGQKDLDSFMDNIDKASIGHTKDGRGKYARAVVSSIAMGDGLSAKSLSSRQTGGGHYDTNSRQLSLLRDSLGITTDMQHAFFQDYMSDRGKINLSRQAGELNSDGTKSYKVYDNPEDAYEDVVVKGKVVGRRIKSDAAFKDKNGRPTAIFFKDMENHIEHRIENRINKRLTVDSQKDDDIMSAGQILNQKELDNSIEMRSGIGNVISALNDGNGMFQASTFNTTEGGTLDGWINEHIGYSKEGTAAKAGNVAWYNFAKNDPGIAQAVKNGEITWGQVFGNGKDGKEPYVKTWLMENGVKNPGAIARFNESIKLQGIEKHVRPIVATNEAFFSQNDNAYSFNPAVNTELQGIYDMKEKPLTTKDGKLLSAFANNQIRLFNKDVGLLGITGTFEDQGSFMLDAPRNVSYSVITKEMENPETGAKVAVQIVDFSKPIRAKEGSVGLQNDTDLQIRHNTYKLFQRLQSSNNPADRQEAMKMKAMMMDVMPYEVSRGIKLKGASIEDLRRLTKGTSFSSLKNINSENADFKAADVEKFKNEYPDEYKSAFRGGFGNVSESMGKLKQKMIDKGYVPNSALKDYGVGRPITGAQSIASSGSTNVKVLVKTKDGIIERDEPIPISKEAYEQMRKENNVQFYEKDGKILFDMDTRMKGAETFIYAPEVYDQMYQKALEKKQSKKGGKNTQSKKGGGFDASKIIIKY